MRSRMLVRSHPDIVKLYVRAPRRHEQDSLESFACHAAGCVTCYRSLSPSSTAVPLCNEGHSKATTLRQLLYAEHGRIYAKPRERVHPKVIVEVHPVFCIARRVLCAAEPTRRLSPNIEALRSCVQLPAKACVKRRQISQCQCSGCYSHSAALAVSGYQAGHKNSMAPIDVPVCWDGHSNRRSVDGGTSYVRGRVDLRQPTNIWHPQLPLRPFNAQSGHKRGDRDSRFRRASKNEWSDRRRYTKSREVTQQECKITVHWD